MLLLILLANAVSSITTNMAVRDAVRDEAKDSTRLLPSGLQSLYNRSWAPENALLSFADLYRQLAGDTVDRRRQSGPVNRFPDRYYSRFQSEPNANLDITTFNRMQKITDGYRK